MGLVDRYRVSLGAALYRMIPSLRGNKIDVYTLIIRYNHNHYNDTKSITL